MVLTSYKKLCPSYVPLPEIIIDRYLGLAMDHAKIALDYNEIPIGTVIVKDDEVIACGYNQTLTSCNIIKHAEIVALEHAQKILHNHRLIDCDLYVTHEPCLMCMGAILHSRIKRVIFGTVEPKTGAIVSQYQVLKNAAVNHQTEAIGPINTKYYNKYLREFLKSKR